MLFVGIALIVIAPPTGVRPSHAEATAPRKRRDAAVIGAFDPGERAAEAAQRP